MDEFDEGSYSIRLTVNDTYDAHGKYTGGSQEVSISWNLTVTNLNRAPVIDTYDPGVLSGETTDEETPMTFAITKSDPDGDSMVVNWYIDDKVQMGAGQNNFVYLGVPDYTAAGPHNIKVVVKDNGQPQIETSITWSIYVNNVNRAPGIKTATPSGKSIKLNEGETEEFKVTAEDPDLEALEYIWTLDGETVEADGSSYTFDTDFDTATGDEMTFLKEQASAMEEELQAIRSRIDELTAEAENKEE